MIGADAQRVAKTPGMLRYQFLGKYRYRIFLSVAGSGMRLGFFQAAGTPHFTQDNLYTNIFRRKSRHLHRRVDPNNVPAGNRRDRRRIRSHKRDLIPDGSDSLVPARSVARKLNIVGTHFRFRGVSRE